MKNTSPKLARDELLERVEYNPETGVFTWKEVSEARLPKPGAAISFNAKYAGKVVGANDTQNGMPRASIDGRIYYLKTMAFVIMTGKEPKGRTGFLDGNKLNTAWSNLVTEKESKAAERDRQSKAALENSNALKAKGVRWCHQSGRYWAFVALAFTNVTIGHYRSATAATEARSRWIAANV